MILNSPYISGSLTVTGNITSQGGITISGSITSASFATTSSFATTASYANTSTSASYALTASFATNATNFTASNILASNTITAQTLVVQTVTSSIVYSSGSNIFGNSLTDTQKMTGSLRVTGSATFSSTLLTGGDITVSKSGDSGINLNSTTTNGVAVTRYQTTAAGNLWGTGINITAADSRYELYNFTLGASPFRISNAGVTTINGDGASLIYQAKTVNADLYLEMKNSAGTRRGYIGYGGVSSTLFEVSNNENGAIDFRTNGAFAMRITASGSVGIGTSSPGSLLHIFGSGSGNNVTYTKYTCGDGGDIRVGKKEGVSNDAIFGTWSNNDVLFYGNQTERLRITSAGLITKTVDNTTTGQIQFGGQTGSPPNAILVGAADQNGPYPIGVKSLSNPTSQGLVGFFDYANGSQGSISISGTTVSYNSFMGSHWSQLSDNSKPEILKGTVLEVIDELCEWENEVNDRLAKIKISNTVESKNVYGVFFDWDNMDNLNDMYVAALGAGYIRVNSSQDISIGDLLQSNGDGTAKVQSDDIMRSSTIAKVVSTNKIETYEDGSYLVAATLHCG